MALYNYLSIHEYQQYVNINKASYYQWRWRYDYYLQNRLKISCLRIRRRRNNRRKNRRRIITKHYIVYNFIVGILTGVRSGRNIHIHDCIVQAIWFNKIDLAMLLTKTVPIQYNYDLVYVLSQACFYGLFDFVKYLVERGVPIGSKCFVNASLNGYIDIVKYIERIERLDIVYVNDVRHLHTSYIVENNKSMGVLCAVKGGHKELCDYFFKTGAWTGEREIRRVQYIAYVNGHIDLYKHIKTKYCHEL